MNANANAGVHWRTAAEIAVRTARDFLDAETKPDFHPQFVFVLPTEEEARGLRRIVASYFPILLDQKVEPIQEKLKEKVQLKSDEQKKKRKILLTVREAFRRLEVEPADETVESKTYKGIEQDNGLYLYFICQTALNLSLCPLLRI